MTSKHHPYPDHVVEAVAYHLAPWLLRGIPATAVTDRVLQALWDASRIDAVSQADQLPDDVRAVSKRGAYMAPWSLDADDLPAHVIDWGQR